MMLKCLGKSGIFQGYFLMIGVLQVIISYLYNKQSTNFSVSELEAFLFNGFFLFLCISLISAICFEFYIDNNHIALKTNRYVNLIVVISAMGIVVVSMVQYSELYLNKFRVPDSSNKDFYIYMQIGMLIVCVLISFFMKFAIYYKNEVAALAKANKP